MRASSSHKLTLLVILLGHLGILSVATDFIVDRCPFSRDDYRHFGRVRHWACIPQPMPTINPCFKEGSLCSTFIDFHDCLLPQFQCLGNGRCIPRSRYCNGIRDCNDGSDEWGCDTTSSDSTATSKMHSEFIDDTSSYIITSTMLRDNEEKATSVILPESEETTSSTTSTMFPRTESNIVLSSSTTTGTMLPDSELNSSLPSSSVTITRLPDSESNTSPSSTSTMLPDSESNTAPSSASTTSTMFPDSESNTTLSSFVAANTMLPESEEKTSSPSTNTIFPDSNAIQSCPDNYCMQNAECAVVHGQYRCKCPSSFIGELCETQLGTKQRAQEYAVAIAIFMTLVVFCLAVVSVCLYQYNRKLERRLIEREKWDQTRIGVKYHGSSATISTPDPIPATKIFTEQKRKHRSSAAWKSNAMSYRTLSQLILTDNAVE